MQDHARACDLVVARLEVTLASVVPPGPLSATTEDLLRGVRRTASSTRAHDLLATHVPLAFAPAVGSIDIEHPMVGVAAACTALHVGARLLDDLMDGHDVSFFESKQAANDVLGWSTFLFIVPPLVLSRIDAPASVRVALIDEMTAGMAAMAAGQLGDVTWAGAIPTPAESMAAIRGKTGALLATFAACGARALGLSGADVAQAHRFGMSLGVGRQLAADRSKVHSPKERRVDRAAPTYLVALLAASLQGPERDEFVALASAAVVDPTARPELARQITESDVLARAALQTELEYANAIAAVDSLKVDPTVKDRLIGLVDAVSALGQ